MQRDTQNINLCKKTTLIDMRGSSHKRTRSVWLSRFLTDERKKVSQIYAIAYTCKSNSKPKIQLSSSFLPRQGQIREEVSVLEETQNSDSIHRMWWNGLIFINYFKTYLSHSRGYISFGSSLSTEGVSEIIGKQRCVRSVYRRINDLKKSITSTKVM